MSDVRTPNKSDFMSQLPGIWEDWKDWASDLGDVLAEHPEDFPAAYVKGAGRFVQSGLNRIGNVFGGLAFGDAAEAYVNFWGDLFQGKDPFTKKKIILPGDKIKAGPLDVMLLNTSVPVNAMLAAVKPGERKAVFETFINLQAASGAAPDVASVWLPVGSIRPDSGEFDGGYRFLQVVNGKLTEKLYPHPAAPIPTWVKRQGFYVMPDGGSIARKTVSIPGYDRATGYAAVDGREREILAKTLINAPAAIAVVKKSLAVSEESPPPIKVPKKSSSSFVPLILGGTLLAGLVWWSSRK